MGQLPDDDPHPGLRRRPRAAKGGDGVLQLDDFRGGDVYRRILLLLLLVLLLLVLLFSRIL